MHLHGSKRGGSSAARFISVGLRDWTDDFPLNKQIIGKIVQIGFGLLSCELLKV